MRLKPIFYLFALCLIIGKGCKPADFYYADYLANGEISYPGKIDSLSCLPGDQRAVVRFRMTTDPKVEKLKLYVRNNLSSTTSVQEFNVEPDQIGEIFTTELNNLTEAVYTINVRTFHANQDSSQAVLTTQRIYGDRYKATLSNRNFENFSVNDGVTVINFIVENNLPEIGTFYTMQRTEVNYQTVDGESKTLSIQPQESSLRLVDIDESFPVTYVSVYKPIESAIDEFKTETDTADVQ